MPMFKDEIYKSICDKLGYIVSDDFQNSVQLNILHEINIAFPSDKIVGTKDGEFFIEQYLTTLAFN